MAESGFRAVFGTAILYITSLVEMIQPYFFGQEFIKILTILLMADMLIGIGKHKKKGDFDWKTMFNKMVFKLLTVAVATVSVKSIIDVTDTMSPEILIVAVKLTVALYLFGNIDRNLCQMTEGRLCFSWLIKKIRKMIPLLKNDDHAEKF